MYIKSHEAYAPPVCGAVSWQAQRMKGQVDQCSDTYAFLVVIASVLDRPQPRSV